MSFALLAVGFQNGFLHLLDGLVERNDIGDLEEGRLHDGVRTRTQTQLGGDLRGVDDIEIDLVLGQVDLHVVGQRRAGRLGVVHRVQQERTAGLSPFSTSYLSTYEGTWHATKSGVVTR